MRNAILFCGLFVLAAASCKKDKEEQEVQTCRITTADIIEDNDSSWMAVTYDAGGRPTSVVQVGETATFTYTGNMVRVERTAQLGTNSYDSVILNGNGQVLTHYRYFGSASVGYRADYVYNGTELLYSTSRSFGSTATPDTVRYEWNGGNMVREIYRNSISDFTYETDKPVVDNSDWLRFFSLINSGGYTILSRNLVKSVSDASDNVTITYELDPNGRILLARFSDRGVERRYRFGYTCE